MVGSGSVVLILCLIFLIHTRKEITLETEQGRIWANITKINILKLQTILQLPSFKSENSKKYEINDYKMLGIGGLFLLLASLIYFILPFSTFVDLFLFRGY